MNFAWLVVPAALFALAASVGPSRSGGDDPGDIAKVLDNLHAAAAAADGPRYFALFSERGVFLGTDASERWTVDAFKAYAEPYFAQGRGWTYLPRPNGRNIEVNGDTAWFDEVLDNAKYGECRGTGVLVRENGHWLIAQYNLTVPIPNELMGDVVEMIQRREERERP